MLVIKVMTVRTFFSEAKQNGVLQTRVLVRETLEEANKFERLLCDWATCKVKVVGSDIRKLVFFRLAS